MAIQYQTPDTDHLLGLKWSRVASCQVSCPLSFSAHAALTFSTDVFSFTKCTAPGRYFIYDYYYVPKHTYYYYSTIYNNIPTPIHHQTHPYNTIYSYTSPYTPTEHYIHLYITINPDTSSYTPIHHHTGDV